VVNFWLLVKILTMSKRSLTKVVGYKIQFLRNQLNLTQEELASRIKMDRSHLGKIENGQANPSIKTLFLIAQALGVRLSSLFKSDPDI